MEIDVKMDKKEALTNFRAWYLDPLEVLKNSPIKENAGWVALMITFPLYERWINSRIKLNDPNQKANKHARNKIIAKDLNFTEEQADDFWVLIRGGLMHQGMPFLRDENPSGLFLSPELGLPEVCQHDGKPIFCLNPWSFADHVIELLQQDEDLWWIFYTTSYPWALVKTWDELPAVRKVENQEYGPSIDFNIQALPPKTSGGKGTIALQSTTSPDE